MYFSAFWVVFRCILVDFVENCGSRGGLPPRGPQFSDRAAGYCRQVGWVLYFQCMVEYWWVFAGFGDILMVFWWLLMYFGCVFLKFLVMLWWFFMHFNRFVMVFDALVVFFDGVWCILVGFWWFLMRFDRFLMGFQVFWVEFAVFSAHKRRPQRP